MIWWGGRLCRPRVQAAHAMVERVGGAAANPTKTRPLAAALDVDYSER